MAVKKFVTLGEMVDAFMEILNPVLESEKGQIFLDRMAETFNLPDLTPNTPAELPAYPMGYNERGQQGTKGAVGVEGISVPMTPALMQALSDAIPGFNATVTSVAKEPAEKPKAPTQADIIALRRAKKQGK